MEKYKLIKEFPGREQGDIAIYVPSISATHFLWDKDRRAVPTDFQPDITPDWFEKVKDKDYEIIKFYYQGARIFSQRNADGTFGTRNGKSCEGLSEKEMLDNEVWEIQSVKRLSDEAIFSVGDYVKNSSCRKRKIERIILTKGKPFGDGIVLMTDEGAGKLKAFKKREYLFTTKDGVRMFEGDSWYYVTHNKISLGARITNTLVYKGENNSEVSHFSTREAANRFIASFRPVIFTTEDKVGLIEGDKYWTINTIHWTRWEARLIARAEVKIPEHIKTFYSKERADEFYYLNKPCLSIKDVATVFKTAVSRNFGNNQQYERNAEALLKIVKSKENGTV